eukprot:scaffold326293_cov58-Tisochrysis_lutea.AAC.2
MAHLPGCPRLSRLLEPLVSLVEVGPSTLSTKRSELLADQLVHFNLLQPAMTKTRGSCLSGADLR